MKNELSVKIYNRHKNFEIVGSLKVKFLSYNVNAVQTPVYCRKKQKNLYL